MKPAGALIGAALATLLALPAQAADWTGCSVGLQAGYSTANTEFGLSGTPLAIDGLSSQGAVGGVHVGCDMQLPAKGMLPIVVGAFADYNWQSLEFEVKPSVVEMTLDGSWTVGARAGVAIGSALPYVLAGYTGTGSEMKLLGTSVVSSDLRGWTAGAGIEMELMRHLTLSGEYRFTRYDTENLAGFVDLDTDQHSFLARVSYRFGGQMLPK